MPRETAQQQHHHRERDQQQQQREREPNTLAVHPRDMPPIGSSHPSPNIPASASISTTTPTMNAPPQLSPLLAESAVGPSGSGSGSSSFLSRIGAPYRSSPTASNSFRSDTALGEQRSWPPEDDWDGTRKRTLSGELCCTPPHPTHVGKHALTLHNASTKTGRKTLSKTRAQTWAQIHNCLNGHALSATGIQAHKHMVSRKNYCPSSTLAPMTSRGLDARTMVNRACCTVHERVPIHHSSFDVFKIHAVPPPPLVNYIHFFPCNVYHEYKLDDATIRSTQSPRKSHLKVRSRECEAS